MRPSIRALLPAVALLAACGAGGAPTAAPSDPTDAGAAPTIDATCTATCAVRAPDGCYSAADCEAHCRKAAPAWAPPVADAFARCVGDDPLCFRRVEGCMLEKLLPVGAPVKVVVSGSGFGADEGRTVRVWHDPQRPDSFGGEAVIRDGRFSLEWTAAYGGYGPDGPLMLLYVDVDADGSCRAGPDTTHSSYAAWDGDFLAPAFVVNLAPPLLDPAFVCDFTP